MELSERSRRTVIASCASLSLGAIAAGCLERFTGSEPDSDVTIDSETEDEESTVDALTFGNTDDPSCGIIFVPQVNMDRASWSEQAETLSGGDRIGLAIDPAENRSTVILDSVAYLRETVGVDHVVLVGASIGGEAAVVAAAERADEVDGIAALSPGGGTDYASAIRARSVFVVAEDDDDRFVETTRTLHENAPEPTRLEMGSGDAHGQRLFETEYGTDVERWIDDLIGAVCDENGA